MLTKDIFTMPYTYIDKHGLSEPETMLSMPPVSAHPVLIARYMLHLATFVQNLRPDFLKSGVAPLSESPKTIMDRIAHQAISLVTTNDELTCCIEGLECIIAESMYQANMGNLRRSWVSCRRAMVTAQLMGLNRQDARANQYKFNVLDANTKYDARHMWFRIVNMDRHMCMILGLPQGCPDKTLASDELLQHDTATGRLERVQCVIASRILERNESGCCDNLAVIHEIDAQLRAVARSLPGKWWLPPTLGSIGSDPRVVFRETRRLFAQVLHYNLLNQLHLPCMLLPSSAPADRQKSRAVCVHASREMLSRFITVRDFHRVAIAYSCRTVDFLGLMAAMTLLLAHIDNQRGVSDTVLSHQYHSDRAMIEQAQESMSELSRLNADSLSAKSSDLILRLLAVAKADDGDTVRVLPGDAEEAGAGSMSVHLPYFGTINITRDGMSREKLDKGCDGVFDGVEVADVEFPALTAGIDDWAFQGVDTAFFENLMRNDFGYASI